MSTYSAPRGPAPKRATQRRRRNKPGSYGAAEPTVGGHADKQPLLGFDAHKLVANLWSALGQSVEGKFFSSADWQRARIEMWYAHTLITAEAVPSANQWTAVQHGMNDLLISPAIKRRAGIELQRAVDADADAAVSLTAKYRQQLKSV